MLGYLESSSRIIQFSSVQLFSHVWLFLTPCIVAHQASPSTTNSWSSLKLMSIESVMPYNHLILCHPLLLPPSISPSIRGFSGTPVGLKRGRRMLSVPGWRMQSLHDAAQGCKPHDTPSLGCYQTRVLISPFRWNVQLRWARLYVIIASPWSWRLDKVLHPWAWTPMISATVTTRLSVFALLWPMDPAVPLRTWQAHRISQEEI